MARNYKNFMLFMFEFEHLVIEIRLKRYVLIGVFSLVPVGLGTLI